MKSYKVSDCVLANKYKEMFRGGLLNFGEAYMKVTELWKEAGQHVGRDSEIEIAKFLLRGIK